MRTLRVALGLLRQDGLYLLQLRQGDPSIGSVGLIGTFGGKLEANETAQQAACREVAEETNIESNVYDWQYLGKVTVISDNQNTLVTIQATAFVLDLESSVEVTAKEGELIKIRVADIATRLDELTPATKALFETLL